MKNILLLLTILIALILIPPAEMRGLSRCSDTLHPQDGITLSNHNNQQCAPAGCCCHPLAEKS